MTNQPVFTYRDLSNFWVCPRQWFYKRQGWHSPKQTHALLRGIFTDLACKAIWLGLDGKHAIDEEVQELASGMITSRIDDASQQVAIIRKAAKDALELTERYMRVYGGALQPISVGQRIYREMPSGLKVGGTPDLIASFQGKKLLIDLKTGRAPSAEYLDLTGQVDYYALLAGDIDLVCYDLISPDLITRVDRPPRWDKGLYIAEQVQQLALYYGSEASFKVAANEPRYGEACYLCDFKGPCNARDNGNDEEEILLQAYWRDA